MHSLSVKSTIQKEEDNDMDNRKKRFYDGFTLAEMLVGLFISMLIAAALVPIIGPKKIKAPLNAFNHGIAACYYEPNGIPNANGDYGNDVTWTRKYFYADNKPNGQAQAVDVDNEYCTFNIPTADYFEIIAIGPGGDGYDDDPNELSLELLANENGGSDIGNGIIHSDDRFEKDIKNATIYNGAIKIKDQLVDVLNLWAQITDTNMDDPALNLTQDQKAARGKLYALYHMKSPIAGSGIGLCIPKEINTQGTNGCRDRCELNNFNNPNCLGPYRHYAMQRLTVGPDGPILDFSFARGIAPDGSGGVVKDNDGINGSFYNPEAVRAIAALDNSYPTCWYFLHQEGLSSGSGIESGPNIGDKIQLFVNGTSKIVIKSEDVATERENIRVSALTQAGGGDMGLNIYQFPMEQTVTYYTSQQGENARLAGGSNTFVTQSGTARAPAHCEQIGVDHCGHTVEIPGTPGVPGGTEITNEPKPRCEGRWNQPQRGEVSAYYEVPANREYNDFEFLSWQYTAPVFRGNIGSGGEPGQESSKIFENLESGTNLYLFPARSSGVGNTTSYVSTSNVIAGSDSYNKRITSAVAGRSYSHQAKEVKFSILSYELPIPKSILPIAKPDNRNIFQYLSKVSKVKVNTAENQLSLSECSDQNCPGFAGNGTYFVFNKVPNNNNLTITNLTNGVSFSDARNAAGIDEQEHNVYCDNGTVPITRVTNFTIPAGIDPEHKMKAFFCNEGRHKGNPGAIIIIW